MSAAPFDNRDGAIWMDGRLVPWRNAQVHVLSHGLHYAGAVFEGVRSYGGRIFKLREHSERLLRSAELLGYRIPFAVEEIDQACRDVLKENGIVDGYLRPLAWRGSEVMGISAQPAQIHLAVAAWPWSSYFSPEARLKGVRMTIAPWRRPAPDTAPTASKASGLYMICTMSKHAAEAQGYQDALLLDYRGRVAEATAANIFFAMDGALHTPIPECFLDGITRRTVIDLARRRGIEVVERAILPEELGNAQEAFLTGTAAEVTPIASIDGHCFQTGRITQTIVEDYHALVRSPAA